MAQFAASSNPTVTASSTNLAVHVLTVLTAGQLARVKMINWGGADTSLISAQVRWSRVTNTPATPTALTITPTNPGTTATATCNTYGTIATAVANVQLFIQAWNQQGGGGVVVLPIGGEWQVVGGALGTTYNQIGCGTVAGSGTNCTFGITWEE